MHRRIIITLGLLYLISFVFGVMNILGNNFSGIAWVFAPLGIFIWGDALIIAPFMITGCIWLLRKNSRIWTGLFLSSYAMARSFVEALYSMNAQFSSTVRLWESNWRGLEIIKSLRMEEVFVLSQLIFTCIFVVSFLVFVHFFKQYLRK